MFDPDEFFSRTGIRLAGADTLDASAITPAVYKEWRSPRCGTANPEYMTNPLWGWLIRTGVSAFQATQRFGGPSPFKAGPAWCFERFGQSVTVLPDGRRVFIAGEHEDYYDPDFHIYNDVVIWSPDGTIEVLGYPKEVFPPTDFHTATLLADAIVIVGNLGYPEHRRAGMTQVAVLNLSDWSIAMIEARGESPEWLHKHEATWDEERKVIRLSKGYLGPTAEGSQRSENLDEWELDPSSWQWTRTSTCLWPRREIHRADNKALGLRMMSVTLSPNPLTSVCLESQMGLALDDNVRDALQSSARETERQARGLEERGVSLQSLQSLYRPSLPHLPVKESDAVEHPSEVKRITVNGVVVRYMDECNYIQLVVEGDLPGSMVDQLAEDLRTKLEAIQGAPCQISNAS